MIKLVEQDSADKILKWDELSDRLKRVAVADAFIKDRGTLSIMYSRSIAEEYNRRVKDLSAKYGLPYDGMDLPFDTYLDGSTVPDDIPEELSRTKFEQETHIPTHRATPDYPSWVSILVSIGFSKSENKYVVSYMGNVYGGWNHSYEEVIESMYDVFEDRIQQNEDILPEGITVDDCLDELDSTLGKLGREIKQFVNKTMAYLSEIREIQNDIVNEFPMLDFIHKVFSENDFSFVVRKSALDGNEFISSIEPSDWYLTLLRKMVGM